MIMNVLYLLVPATVVRPSLESTDVFSVLLRDLVWKLDEPVNTFPSNHVTFSVIAILALSSLRLESWWVLPLQVWFGLICLSTLLVYQHVVLDLVSGVAIGILVYFATLKLFVMRQTK
jgi:membrane-associated phospholipid phosphatase